MKNVKDLKLWAKAIKREAVALYIACRDPRTPVMAKIIAGFVVAYIFSPIDLIPDFIPVIGYLDDLLLVPLGIWAAKKMIPEEVMIDARMKANDFFQNKPRIIWGAVIIGFIWLALLALLIMLVMKMVHRPA
ncbi:MAG: YkvA family protein [bacterium]